MLAAAAALAAALQWAGHQGWAVATAFVVVTLHAPVLAAEFVLMARVNRIDAVPPASPRDCIVAWWGEFVASSVAFGWRQPWRSRAIADDQAASGAGRRGVVLVHGFVCNRGLWNPWMHELRRAGVPFVAVNLEPLFCSIDRYVPIVEAAVSRLERNTGMPPLIVAHSMGGLAVRRWLAEQRDAGRVHHVLTMGTPHHGTWLGRFAASRNAREMRSASEWQQRLRSREGDFGRFSCYYSHCDNIVFPASTATLPGARNIHLPATAHVRMVDHPLPFQEAMQLLS